MLQVCWLANAGRYRPTTKSMQRAIVIKPASHDSLYLYEKIHQFVFLQFIGYVHDAAIFNNIYADSLSPALFPYLERIPMHMHEICHDVILYWYALISYLASQV